MNKKTQEKLSAMIANEQALPIMTPCELDALIQLSDSIQMLEWLFLTDIYGRFKWQELYDEWNGEDCFQSFCEAKYREERGAK